MQETLRAQAIRWQIRVPASERITAAKAGLAWEDAELVMGREFPQLLLLPWFKSRYRDSVKP
jgi:hypothetical protein